MKQFALLVQVMVTALAWLMSPGMVLGDVISIPRGTYAAIAYSPSTGNVCYSYNMPGRAEAEKDALSRCSDQDAEIVCWVEKGFCALALGSDKASWGGGASYGNGASTDAAKDAALAKYGDKTTGSHVEVYLSSDGQVLWEQAKHSLIIRNTGEVILNGDVILPAFDTAKGQDQPVGSPPP